MCVGMCWRNCVIQSNLSTGVSCTDAMGRILYELSSLRALWSLALMVILAPLVLRASSFFPSYCVNSVRLSTTRDLIMSLAFFPFVLCSTNGVLCSLRCFGENLYLTHCIHLWSF